MTETREQWIEREARKARERYWHGENADWEGAGDAIRSDWRRVVAPYYPSPLRVPVDVEGLAEVIKHAMRRAFWDPLDGDIGTGWTAAASAALAYLNIEPCPAPEYNPDDVALNKPHAAINGNCPDVFRDCERWMAEGPGTKNIESFLEKACDREGRYNVQRLLYLIDKLADERGKADDVALTPNNVNITGADPSRMVFFINGKQLVSQSALDEALAKIERQRNQLHAQCKAIESRGGEIARLENEVKRLRQWQDSVMQAVKEVPK